MSELDLHEVSAVAERLAAWARAFVHRDAVVDDVRPLPGHSGHSYAFQVSSGRAPERLVLRVSAPGARSGSHADATRVVPRLTSMAACGVPVPGVRWWSGAPDWFGGSATVVEFVAGFTLPDIFDLAATAPDHDVDVAAVFRSAVGALVRMHAIDAGPRLSGWGRAKSLADVVDASTRPLQTAPDRAWIDHGLRVRDALLREMPPERAPGVVHNDFYSNNWIVGPSELHGVLDWESSFLGQRTMDVGWLCMIYDPASWSPIRRPAMGWHPTPAELVGWYEELSGGPVPDLTWFRALAGYRLACGTAYYLDLHRRGRRHDPMWEDAGQSFPHLLDRALELLSKGDADGAI
ncbi:phosphotransferase family protein [Acrocarpospora catenulata]|uniref:phosphotransferase family protein n=1 Tax=Acrocarpospora catenulata TaxID=2836182 RepID=UPI001BDB0036|nr:phosphotransferase family protein [Acrocarpospora catenulata]